MDFVNRAIAAADEHRRSQEQARRELEARQAERLLERVREVMGYEGDPAAIRVRESRVELPVGPCIRFVLSVDAWDASSMDVIVTCEACRRSDDDYFESLWSARSLAEVGQAIKTLQEHRRRVHRLTGDLPM